MASKDLEPNHPSRLKASIRSYRVKAKPPPPTASLFGQTVIITGSNVGIGLECARILLGMDLSHLIMAVRNVDKGEKAAAPLRQAHPSARVEVWTLDMNSYESIQTFVERCDTSLSRIDIAILNAGIMQLGFEVNKNTGHEEMFQVNYLSTALLAILLLPFLKAKKPPNNPARLTMVSSGLALLSKFSNHGAVPLIPSFDVKPDWNMNAANERYSITKTLLLMLVLKLSQHVNTKDVIVNTVDPGLVGGTGLHQGWHGFAGAMIGAIKTITARTLEEGAWSYIDAVLVQDQLSHGSFVMDWKISPFHRMMYTPEGRQTTEKLWDETLHELHFANVKGALGLHS